MKMAAIGEAMIELSMDDAQAAVRVAGDTLNTAIYLKREAPELQVDYVTRLGTDAFSDRIVAAMTAEDIGTHAVERDPDGTRVFTPSQLMLGVNAALHTGETLPQRVRCL